MVFDTLKNSFNDAVGRTRDAISSVEDATEGKEEEELESEYEREMKHLVQEYKDQLVRTIFSHLDNQDWEKAERIAHEEGGVSDEGWRDIVNSYIKHRLRRGQTKLKVIGFQLTRAETKLEQADKMDVLSSFEDYVKQALTAYKKIEQDEILEAQRDISRAENAFERFGGSSKGKKIFRAEHRNANRLDKDIKQAQKDLQGLINRLES